MRSQKSEKPAPAASGNGLQSFDHAGELIERDATSYTRIDQAKPIRATLRDSTVCEFGDVRIVARAPVLAMCRALIERGHDPATPLEVYRGDTLALRIVMLAAGAWLTVDESRTPRFARFRPACDHSDLAPHVRKLKVRATGVAGRDCERASAGGSA